MPLRYKLVNPDGHTRYETDSLADARREWRFRIGKGSKLIDALDEAGLVRAPGDSTPIRKLAAVMCDHLEWELALEFPLHARLITGHQIRLDLLRQMEELIERTLVDAVVESPDPDVKVR